MLLASPPGSFSGIRSRVSNACCAARTASNRDSFPALMKAKGNSPGWAHCFVRGMDAHRDLLAMAGRPGRLKVNS
jgi:hypothetical protein